jgi:hypothetical protein
MKITQITYTARKGMPAYSHEEIVAVAMISDSGNPDAQADEIRHVKRMVDAILHGTVPAPAVTQTVVENSVKVVDKAPVDTTPSAATTNVSETPAAAPKEEKPKRQRKSTVETKEDGTTTAQLGDEPEATLNIKKDEPKKEESKNVEKYDRTIKEHTSTFAGHLTKTYGNTWKEKEGLKAFSEGLNGKEFRDTKTGLLVPSFVAEIEKFFGNGENVL